MSIEETANWIVAISPTVERFVATLREISDISHETMEAYWSSYKDKETTPTNLDALKNRTSKAAEHIQQQKQEANEPEAPTEIRDFQRLILESMDRGLATANHLTAFFEKQDFESLIEAQGTMSEAIGQTIITTTELGKMLQAPIEEE
jgi:hypothetical protein